MLQKKRIVITGVGLTAPNGNNLSEFRQSLLCGKSGIRKFETRYIGEVLAGACNFDELRYQKKKELRRGTRAGSISIYCANEAFKDSKLDLSTLDTSRIGVYIGTTEHGNVETENEIYNLSQYKYDLNFWSHHHNPRTVANNPAGEVTINLKITGPHYCIGAACAAGNLGLVQGYQMLQLDEIEMAVAGGVSESIHTFGIFASFKNEMALGSHPDPAKASRPFDKARNGIVVSEGGCLFILETLEHAKARGAKIYCEIAGYGVNSDAFDFIQPDHRQQAVCLRNALKKAGIQPADIDLINTHATSTPIGDIEEIKAVREVFGIDSKVYINNTKSFIGHAMGAAGALELAGNLPSFEDNVIHPTINVENLDPECFMPNLVMNKSLKVDKIDYILNSSFGMLGINSSVIVKKYKI
ncbi:MAG: beta-ketoacyl-[acyl-carrier-protein] synthase family protein [Candidatus Wallbacteria bacterium]|nr:beta-ketoacyl-[acyl-carrier-protein] synthase family protein [Candidatus Wallbacteria bacterium]